MKLASDRLAVLEPYRQKSFQLFRVWFADACQRAGIKHQADLPLTWNLRLVLGKLGLCFNIFKFGRLIVCSGGKPEYYAWPWCYFYDIVPVVWDCWPECEAALLKFIRRNRVKTIFCTASQTAAMVKRRFPEIDAVWLPEGIDVSVYPKGPALAERNIDILEMGRKMESIHHAIVAHNFKQPVVHLYQTDKLVFPDNQAMITGMQNTKISICYPQSDTNPEHAGNIETMTQRYWEFMLAGALIVGRAPKELVEFCGYNPVVELGNRPAAQIEEMLAHISDYQPLVDRNRAVAEQIGSWDSRMGLVMEHLK